MSHICWGVEGAREELERLTSDEEKMILNVVEVREPSDRYFYQLHMQPDAAIVDIGSGFKNHTYLEGMCKHPEEAGLRRRISNVLNTPHPCYQRMGEMVLASLGLGHFHIPTDGKHLSPRDELNIVQAALSCAQTIGFNRISLIGRTEVNASKLRQAFEELSRRYSRIATSYQ